MMLEADRAALLQAARTAAKVAPQSSLSETLGGALIECCEESGTAALTAANGEAAVRLTVPARAASSSAALADARLLEKLLSTLKGETARLETDGRGSLSVSDGKPGSVCRIRCRPHESYPRPDMAAPGKAFKVHGIRSLAEKTAYAAGSGQSSPAMQCVNFRAGGKAVYAEACDSARMAVAKCAATLEAGQSLMVPARLLRLLASVSDDSDAYEASEGHGHIVFRKDGMEFLMRKLPGSFMDTTSVLRSAKPAHSATADAREMLRALETVAISALAETAPKPVRLAMAAGEIRVWTEGGSSEGEASVPADTLAETPGRGFPYNAALLAQPFRLIKGRAKIEISDRGILVAKNDGELHMLAPMREPAAAAENKGEARAA